MLKEIIIPKTSDYSVMKCLPKAHRGGGEEAHRAVRFWASPANNEKDPTVVAKRSPGNNSESVEVGEWSGAEWGKR